MAQDQTGAQTGAEAGEASAGHADLAGGSYELIRQRLLAQAGELGQLAGALNGRRTEVFGGTQLAVIGNARVRTENNCRPRDIVQVSGHMLFGYNVFVGLRTETKVADVMGLYDLSDADNTFALELLSQGHEDTGFLSGSGFLRDFEELYRYYKDAHLVRLARNETHLLAVFQIGASESDLKVFRWQLSPSAPAAYIDNRGDREYRFPPSHSFEWTPCTREHQVSGRIPHVNIEDELFVETSGGDLTIKVENNTDTGEGVYSEPVEEDNQSLDDADIAYARVGMLILLRVRPYREEDYRYLVFATRSHRVQRVDAVGEACIELPEDHGVIFPGGYVLQDGQCKLFDGDYHEFRYERRVRSPNGEDVLYVFHRHADGHYVLFPYNLIRKEVQNPIHCHGYSLFEDGRMVIFRTTSDEPTRVHAMQLWQTPFVSDEFAARQPPGDGLLENVGNAELVRAISDCFSIQRAVEATEPSRQIYEDLIAAIGRALDAYYWLAEDEVGNLQKVLETLRGTTELIVDEFVKVTELRALARKALSDADGELSSLLARSRPDVFSTAQEFMEGLTALRRQRGHIIGLKEVRYIDLQKVEAFEASTVEAFDRLSQATAAFMLRDEALSPLADRIAGLLTEIEAADKTTDLDRLGETLETQAEGLGLLSEVVAGLQVEDPAQRTEILERISEVFGQLNRVRATHANRRKELLSVEGRAEFAAQFTLFSQSVTSAMGLVDTPEACDDQLSRLMVQLEELEARFSEFDEFLGDLTAKREEVYQAFEQKKQQLLDERQRRAANLVSAADRILQGVARRAKTFAEAEELNAYFASDPMVLKLQELAGRLVELGDGTRAEELRSRLKNERQNAARGLRDRLDLFEEGDAIIKFGRHRFAVNTEAVELTLLPADEGMQLSLSGTNYREPVDDEAFAQTRPYWSQQLVSETDDVYRGEYLAATLLFDAENGREGLSLQGLRDAERTEEGLLPLVRKRAATRFDEGYERGLHDADAAAILAALLHLRDGAGTLRFAPKARAIGLLYWAFGEPEAERDGYRRRAQSLSRLTEEFAHTEGLGALAEEFRARLAAFATDEALAVSEATLREAGHYLAHELGHAEVRFVCSGEADALGNALLDHMHVAGVRKRFEEDLVALDGTLAPRLSLVLAWLKGFVGRRQADGAGEGTQWEAGARLLCEGHLSFEVSSARTALDVEGLLGQHPRITQRILKVDLSEFTSRLSEFVHTRVPGYHAYRDTRRALLSRERERLRLSEFEPRVLSSFVRNRLINEVYLPIIGDNLAKQIGAVGDSKRTDLMGLLLLISPPGYGKTTLMEYIASRLGLVFMKVNGPSLGHDVTSLDPAQAQSATARQEVEKVNLALEMGNNVMLYLDDIQHTHPEFLQKFISLCDGQRRIEGVWKGRTRTYDLRGRRFCVVMAGNPYTESGEKFQIPDMLSNRADTYNLGDILGGKKDAFALSYVENAITSNPVLSQLANRDQADVYRFVDMAQGREVRTSELSHGYSSVEIDEIVAVMKRMFVARDVLLKVNQAYIASASMDDAFRTEPPFKLQGSYRNMNKLAEKLVAAMNDAELQQLIADHYLGEAQTLTTGAEQNLLKLGALRGVMSEAERARWEDMKKAFRRVQTLGGGDDDPVTRVVGQLGGVSTQLEGIRDVLEAAAAEPPAGTPPTDTDDAGEMPLGSAVIDSLLPAVSELTEALSTLAGESATRSRQEREALVAHLGRLEQALAARAAPPPVVAHDPSAVSEALSAPLVAIGEALATLSSGEALAALSKRTEGAQDPAQPVQVTVNTEVTPELRRMLAQQYRLVRDALLPLVNRISTVGVVDHGQSTPVAAGARAGATGGPEAGQLAAAADEELNRTLGHLLGLTRAIAERIDDIQHTQRIALRSSAARRPSGSQAPGAPKGSTAPRAPKPAKAPKG